MNKGLKITLIVIGVLLGIILIDTMQAKIFNNSPLLKIRENMDGGSTDYIDKGLFVNHYKCNNKEEKTIFKGVKYSCPMEEQKNKDLEESTYNINNDIITLSIKEGTMTTSSLTLILHNNTNDTYYYGAGSGVIEKEENGKWYKLKAIKEENIIAIAYSINPGEDREFVTNFGNIYGKLPKGKYRVVKSFTVDEEFHNHELSEDDIYSAVEFEIE